MKSPLRQQVETSKSLLDLYRVATARLSSLDQDERQALKRSPKTQAFRTQLGDSLSTLEVPKFDLGVKGALCAIVDQCEDEAEEEELCEAILLYIGWEVEVYVRAILSDPDQRSYKGEGLEGILQAS